MSKIIFAFLLMIIIDNVYTGTLCEGAGAGEEGGQGGQERRLATDFSNSYCRGFSTSDNKKICVANEAKTACIEVDSSECYNKVLSNSRRLATTELTDEDCEPLKTSNDDKYICVVSDDGQSCEEVEGSNGLKLSLTILCLLLFL